ERLKYKPIFHLPNHSMIYEGKVIPFPAVVQTSFFKIIEDMERKANDLDENLSARRQEMVLLCPHISLNDSVNGKWVYISDVRLSFIF
ncbi:MAG: hypothetical protein RID25_15880, partial [Cyclobacteriaceae bacterium]